MFEATQDILAASGMPAYEISNHARPGEESRHNLTCWRGGDYLGIGPGAHGRLNIDGAFLRDASNPQPGALAAACRRETGTAPPKDDPLIPATAPAS